MTEKCDEMSKQEKEMRCVGTRLADGAREIEHREELIERLTHELSSLQDELTKSHEKLSDHENNVHKLRTKLDQRSTEVCTMTINGAC